MAGTVKNNLELAGSDRRAQELHRLVMEQLAQHGLYQRSSFALRVAAPLFIKYSTGMYYGDHVDNPVMGKGELYRCDIAVTVFLNEDYDGGELVVETPFGPQSVRLPAGDAVMYPASSLHRVNPVTRGERLVAVTWLQSMIRSAEQRDILVTLSESRDRLLQAAGQGQVAEQIDHVYVNLVRMWAQL